MSKRNAILVGATVVLFVGSSAMTSPSRGSATAAVTSPVPAVEMHSAQVRAEYIDLDGNLDETNTTLTIVNRSLSKTLYLGDVFALGPDGLNEVLAVHTGSNGVGIPPLGSLDLPVDAANFPGLQPKLQNDSRGLESVLVSWSGPKEIVRLTAAIHLEEPGSKHNRVINRVDGHPVTK